MDKEDFYAEKFIQEITHKIEGTSILDYFNQNQYQLKEDTKINFFREIIKSNWNLIRDKTVVILNPGIGMIPLMIS